ncbi:MAG: hypothetical protein KDB27_09805 [Planctomycetales bacterium]|nr:hypothetical protein [Planctomycetales bacterium]
MVNADTLRELTVSAFRKNAIRSVLLMDERFPKHYQVGTEAFDTADAKVCAKLYKEFNDQGLLCDVENDTGLMKAGTASQIQKSDLLVLDLHLNKSDDTDIADSVEILKSLADSDHFNLVIVYTAMKELHAVGRQLAGSLRGKTSSVEADENVRDDITIAVTELRESNIEIPITDCIDSFLLGGRHSGAELGKFKGVVAKDLDQALKPFINVIVCDLALHALEHDYKSIMEAETRDIKAGNFSTTNPWFACGSLFVVVANKQETPPSDGALLAVLDEALTDWNPGVVRCLLSEIQNCIVNSGCPYDTVVENDALTQVGWLYHAKQEQAISAERWKVAVSQLTERVLGTLGRQVASKASLIELSDKSLGAIEFADDPKERIAELSRANGVPEDMKLVFIDVLHALNVFLSSDEFGAERHYVTTGTVLKTSLGGDDEWWLCVEPGCDTVPDQSGDDQFIRLRMLRLKPVTSLKRPLTTATHGRFVFVCHEDQRFYFDTQDKTHDLIEVYVPRQNQIVDENGMRIVRFWKIRTDSDTLSHVEGQAVPISQMREANASRLLHEAGHHQSRTGVDFVRCTEEDFDAFNAPRRQRNEV